MKRVLCNLLAFIIFVIFVNVHVKTGKTTLPAITFQNIEALSNYESPLVFCNGIGSVDCPRYKTKAIFVYE